MDFVTSRFEANFVTHKIVHFEDKVNVEIKRYLIVNFFLSIELLLFYVRTYVFILILSIT